MNYFKIDREDMVNGEGLRVVLWVAGCEHVCPGCQNAETWCKNSGQKFTRESFEVLVNYLKEPHISGLTLSGGDPLETYNREEVTLICKEIRQIFGDTKTIWVYTGYKLEDLEHEEILNYIDTLIDGEFIESKYNPDLAWRGSSNQRVIDIPKTLKCKRVEELYT